MANTLLQGDLLILGASDSDPGIFYANPDVAEALLLRPDLATVQARGSFFSVSNNLDKVAFRNGSNGISIASLDGTGTVISSTRTAATLSIMRWLSDDSEIIVLNSSTAPYVERYDASTLNRLTDVATFAGALGFIAPHPVHADLFLTGRNASSTTVTVERLTAVNARTGTKTDLPLTSTGSVLDGQFTKDGSRFLGTVGSSVTALYLYDTSSSNPADWVQLENLSGAAVAGSSTIRQAFWIADHQVVAYYNGGALLRLTRISDMAAMNITVNTFGGTADKIIPESSTTFLVCESANGRLARWTFDLDTLTSSKAYLPLAITCVFAANYGLPVLRKLAGTIKDGSNAPLARRVMAISTANKRIMGETTSNAVGDFTLNTRHYTPMSVIACGTGNEQDAIATNKMPVPR